MTFRVSCSRDEALVKAQTVTKEAPSLWIWDLLRVALLHVILLFRA
jgi:hypothetical protein